MTTKSEQTYNIQSNFQKKRQRNTVDKNIKANKKYKTNIIVPLYDMIQITKVKYVICFDNIIHH